MKKQNYFNILILLFLTIISFNCTNINAQQNCKNIDLEVPLNQPKYYYEYCIWEESPDIESESNLLYIFKRDLSKNDKISSAQVKRGIRPYEAEALKLDQYRSSHLQISEDYQYDDQGKIQSIKKVTKDSILISEINYAYLNNNTIQTQYNFLLKEGMNQKTISTIENCKIINRKTYDETDRLTWVQDYKPDLILNNTIHFKNKTVQQTDRTKIIAKDKKGNWIEKTIKQDDQKSYRHIYRHIVYDSDSPKIYFPTLDDLVNELLEAFKNGNFDKIKKHGLMGREDYLYLTLETETSILDNYLRLISLKGEDFVKDKLSSVFINFRLKKSLDWNKVTLENKKLDIRKEGFHPIPKEAARVKLELTDGNKTTYYRFNAIHLAAGWKFFYIR